MTSRTESRDLGDRTEVIVYSDGVEVSRAIKHKNLSPTWKESLKANGNRNPECVHMGERRGQPIKVECSCSDTGEKLVVAHECAIETIQRCLPMFHPNKKDKATWLSRKPESDIYKLCDSCEHFRMKEKT